MWPSTPLGEILDPVRREREVSPVENYGLLGVRLYGAGPFLRETKLGSAIAAKKLFEVRAGDFIYSRLFAWRGAFGLIPESLDGHCVSSEFLTYLPIPDRVDLRFLNYWFRLPSVLRRVEADCTGSTPLTRNRFKERFFLALELPLPPIEEQRRIVARIERLVAKVEKARRQKEKVAALMTALESSLSDSLVPSDAATAPLEKFVQRGSKISYGVLKPGPNVEDGIPFVRVQDLAVDGTPENPNKRIAPEVDANYERTRLKGGEVLVGVVGSIGKIGIAPLTWAGANIARAVARIVPSLDTSAEFLAAMLQAPRAQRYLRDTTRTLAQPTLNIGQLKKTPIPDLPLPEQQTLVSQIRESQQALARLKRVQGTSEAGLDALLPSILDKAFNGGL